MKYREVHQLLNKYGFEIEYYQTDGDLPTLSYCHPNIKQQKEIFISFSSCIDYPDGIDENSVLDLRDEWILDLPISCVHSTYDCGVSYMSNGVISTCGGDDENEIYLRGDDVKYLPIILDYITGDILIHIKKYHTNTLTFLNSISEYINILKSDFKFNNWVILNLAGNESTQIKNFGIGCEHGHGIGIYFEMNMFDLTQSYISINLNYTDHVHLNLYDTNINEVIKHINIQLSN